MLVVTLFVIFPVFFLCRILASFLASRFSTVHVLPPPLPQDHHHKGGRGPGLPPVLEAIRGSKLPGNAEKLIQGSGFLFFAGCGAVILFKDFADLLIPRL